MARARWGLLAGFALVLGCGQPRFAGTRAHDNVLRIPINISLTSFDPALVADNWSIDVLQNTFEGLVVMGEDNRIHPGLAKNWTVSADGRTYSFHLERARFQSGRVVTADAVKQSFERACSKDLAAPLASDFLSDIVGMEPYREGKTPSLSGIRVKDDRTLEIEITSPRPYFIAKLTLPVAAIVDVEAIQDHVHIRSVGEMVGAGPFRMSRVVDGQIIVQTAFRDYHGGPPQVDGIERPIMRDPASRLGAFLRGELDAVEQLSRSDYLALTSDPAHRDQVQLLPRATLVYLALDARAFPERSVRQAIAAALDRDRIAKDTMFGTVTPAHGYVPPGIPGYNSTPLPRPIGSVGRREIRIAYAMENPDIERIAEQVADQLGRIGLSVRLEKMDTATLIDRQNRKDLDAEITGWFADYLDPQDFLSLLLTTDSPENHWHYANPQVDALCREADGATRGRLELYARAEALALADAVVIPLAFWETSIIVSPRVHGLRSSAAQWLPYNTVRLDR